MYQKMLAGCRCTVQSINGMTLKQCKKLIGIPAKDTRRLWGYYGIFGTFSEVVVW